jgi:hypothetical protein
VLSTFRAFSVYLGDYKIASSVGRTSPLVKQVQLYDVEQVSNFRLLQIDRLLKAIVRAGYILLH